MKVLIELPDVIRDKSGNEYEATGERRPPKTHDTFLGVDCVAHVAAFDFRDNHIILRRKWTWPTWLEGWGIAMDANGSCFAFAKRPERSTYTWQPQYDGAFFRWCPKLLGPPPPITDWTQPILNPNYKGDA